MGDNVTALQGAGSLGEDRVMEVLKSSLYPGAKENSIRMVMDYCRAAELDPMQKPVHIVPMWVKESASGKGEMRDVVMPGIGLYRVQAARSGEHAGTSEPEFGPEVTSTLGDAPFSYPEWCRITVYRRMRDGDVVSFTAKEFWQENYATAGRDTSAPNAMWRKRRYGQIAKCTEAQALRKAFPEFGSAPTAEEMEGKDLRSESDTSHAPGIRHAPGRKRDEPQPYPADQFEANLPKWAEVIQAGKKTANQIIEMVQTKGFLTDEQQQQIREQEVVDAEFTEGEEA